jgi:hypothetical protein
MKLKTTVSHAAALALVGWYIMIPPPAPNTKQLVDTDAPLSKWKVWIAADSAEACNQKQQELRKAANHAAAEDPNRVAAQGYASQMAFSQCISSDDSRLQK